MHILLLDLGREMRGGQWQVYYLAAALVRSEHFTVTLAALKGSPLAERAQALTGLTLVELSSTKEWHPGNLYTLRKIIRNEQVAILHTHCAKSASLGAVCKKLWNNFRLVHSRRVSYPLKKGWSGTKYHLADAVVGVSHEIAETLTASGLSEQIVHVIHSGIDTARYTKRESRNDSRYIIGMVGAMTTQKGYEVLLNALAALHAMQDVPQWEARLIGSGPLFQELMELAETLGVSSRIAMLGWQEAVDFLPEFDVLAVPSINGEGSSGTIKEGWATGIPVICSDLPSNLELVKHEQNGLTFSSGKPDELAARLKELMHNLPLYEKLTAAGFQSAEAFSAQTMAEKYMALYNTLQ